MNTARLVFTIVLCAAASLGAEEFQANVRTAENQCHPALATGRDGGFVLVWSSYFSSPGRSNEIIARPFDPNGTPTGEEFQMNQIGAGNQTEPSLAINGEGYLLAAWHGPGADGEEDIFARVFDPNGDPVTDELAVNADPNGRQRYPSVAAGDSGLFIIAWESQPSDEMDGNTTIRAQRFDPNGAPVGPEIRIDEDAYDCRYPEVASDAAGNVAVVWMQDRTGKIIYARLLDPNGAAISPPFEVNVDDIASVTRPAVAMTAVGDFVVVWDGDPNLAGLDDIHARCFEPNGAPHSDPFLVNVLREGPQQWPQVAINDANEFVVVWQHEHEDPNLATDIFARRFDYHSRPLCDETKLNGYVAGKQRYPDVALATDGSFLAAWESDDQDGSDYGVFAHLEPPMAMADPNANGVAEEGFEAYRSETPGPHQRE